MDRMKQEQGHRSILAVAGVPFFLSIRVVELSDNGGAHKSSMF